MIFGIDLRTLALFRVLLGLYLLADTCLRLRDLRAHYTDAGIMPRPVQMDMLSPSSWSLHLANGSALFQGILFFIAALAALGLLVGWRTRLMTILSWVLLLSVQNRNTFILSGEDNLALLLLFWAMFLPLGARYSVEAALCRPDPRHGNGYVSVATAALLIQGMSMYFFSAILKTHPMWVPDGAAVYYALQLEYIVTPFALWFRQFDGLLRGLTYYVYFLELIGPILIFSPVFHKTLRPLLMVAFMTMHLGFALFLEIGQFPVISIIMNLTFFPGWIWDRVDDWRKRRTSEPVTIWFDRGCDFCEKSCRLLRVFLVLPEAAIRPAQDDPDIGAELAARNSWVITVGNERYFKAGAMGALFAASPFFRPLSGLLKTRPVEAIGDRVYDLVARNRSSLSGVTKHMLPWRPEARRPGWLVQTCAGVFLVFITIQNVSTIPAAGLSLPESFVRVRQALGLYQNWTMFAPHPELTSPWPVIEGTLTDGTVVDVYQGKAGPAEFAKPEVVSAVYRNYRWRKFLSNLEDQSYEDVPQVLALNYARYLCRTWPLEHPNAAPLSAFQIYFQVEWTPPPGIGKYVRRRLVWTHDCFG